VGELAGMKITIQLDEFRHKSGLRVNPNPIKETAPE
jgi:hypothetical protein